MVFGPAPDSAMYVSIGSSCNLCVEKDSDRAVVMRYDTDGSHGRVFARGLRNAVGLAIAPGDGIGGMDVTAPSLAHLRTTAISAAAGTTTTESGGISA